MCGDVLDQFVSFLVQHKVGDLPNTNVAVAPNERTKTKLNQEPAKQPRCSRHVAYNAWSLQVVCRSLEYRVQVVCLVHGARLQVKVSEVACRINSKCFFIAKTYGLNFESHDFSDQSSYPGPA